MKWHDYLIHYSFEKEGTIGLCNGSIHLSRTKKINSFEEVNSVVAYLEEQNEGAKNLLINNFMYLGRNRHEY